MCVIYNSHLRHAPSLGTIRLFGCASCFAQLVITATLPLILWFSVFRLDERLQYLAFITWGAASFVGLLGLLAFALLHSLVLGAHAVLAVAVAASLGAVQTSSYLMLVDRCAMSQASFFGCSNCTCAPWDRCTKLLLASDPSCRGCNAMGTDVCDLVTDKSGLVAYAGLVCLLALVLPAVLSFQAFSRMEIEGSSISNRLQYARNVVSREVSNLETHRPASVPADLLEELSSTLLAYGHLADKGLALRCCGLANLQMQELAAALGGEGKALESVLSPQNSPGALRPSLGRLLSAGSNRSAVRVAPETLSDLVTDTPEPRVSGPGTAEPSRSSLRSIASICLQQAPSPGTSHPDLPSPPALQHIAASRAVWAADSRHASRLNPSALPPAASTEAAPPPARGEMEVDSISSTPAHSDAVTELDRGQSFRMPGQIQAESGSSPYSDGYSGGTPPQMREGRKGQPLSKQLKKKIMSNKMYELEELEDDPAPAGHDSLRRPGGVSMKKKGKSSKKLGATGSLPV